MKKKIIAITLSVSMALFMAGCGGSGKESPAAAGSETAAKTAGGSSDSVTASAGNAELIAIASEGLNTSIACDPIELSLGCSGTVDGTVMGDAIYAAIEAAKSWTDGNFVVNFYPGGQLGGDVELIEGAQMGSVDMFTGAPTSQVGLIPELAVLDIGGLYADVDSANQVYPALRINWNHTTIRQACIWLRCMHLISAFCPATNRLQRQQTFRDLTSVPRRINTIWRSGKSWEPTRRLWPLENYILPFSRECWMRRKIRGHLSWEPSSVKFRNTL